MERKELISRYLEFFKSKNHKVIPGASLVPQNDPTVLFTTAGMHPLVPYFLGEKHPLGKRLANVQKCIRTQDIDSVGDSYHHTFFEMLGNWSMGDYFKKEAIEYSFEFLTKIIDIPVNHLAVTVFKGDKDAPRDEESAKIWHSLGIPKERIAFLEKENNWWGPAGQTGPCGPDTEMFYWKSKNPAPKTFDPKDKTWVEIWNDVLMQYVKNPEGKYEEAKQKNIDTGMGVERTVAVLNGFEDNYQTDCFLPIIKKIEKLSGKKYKGHEKEMRIISDHVKAAVFIISDGIVPGNKERGYVLRRLIRRAVIYGKAKLGIDGNFLKKIAGPVFEIYGDYEPVANGKERIMNELSDEEEKFNETLSKGLEVFSENLSGDKEKMSGKEAFFLYQSYGLPFEMVVEMLGEKGIKVDRKKMEDEFEKEQKKHQELSRTASVGKFKSGLADHSEKTTGLHTATHMLNAALKIVLKDNEIRQKGSNITPERLRFDFNFPRKLAENEIQEIENLINRKISLGLEVKREEMSLNQALASGAEAEFGAKYPEKVSVYTVLDPSGNRGFFSREICTGPHVKNTEEMGRFKILKEESSAAGIRRIKAVLE